MASNYTDPVADQVEIALKEEFGTLSYEWVDPQTGQPLTPQEVQESINVYGSFIVEEADGQQYQFKALEDKRLNGYDYGLCVLKLSPDSSQFYGFAYNRVINSEQPGLLMASLSEEADLLREDFLSFLSQYKTGEGTQADAFEGVSDFGQLEEIPAGQTTAPIADTLPEGEVLGPLPDPLGDGQLGDPTLAAGETFGPVMTDTDGTLRFPGKYLTTISDQQAIMENLPTIFREDADPYFEQKGEPEYYIISEDANEELSPVERLTKTPTQALKKMLEIDNNEVASLLPKIQLWKAITDDDGRVIDEIYIPYTTDSRNFIKDVFSNKDDRGDDVGIRDVSLVYDNQNPATAEKLLGCSITYVFQNAGTLIKDRNGFRFVDLFAFDKKQREKFGSEIYDDTKYDIFLRIGYEVPMEQGSISKDLKKAIGYQDQILRLQLTEYDLTFDANGYLEISAQYSSANVEFFSSDKHEILGVKRLLQMNEDNPENQDAESIPPRVSKIDLYKGITDYMAANDMVRTAKASQYYEAFKNSRGDLIPQEQMSETVDALDKLTTQPGVDLFAGIRSSGTTDKGFKSELVEEYRKDFVSTQQDTEDREISYFYFGDLLEAVLATNPETYKSMLGRNFAFILDNMGYQFLKGETISVFNIRKLPISVEMYTQWFQKNYITKDVQITSLMSMIKRMIFGLASAASKTRSPDKIGQDYSPSLTRDTVEVPYGLPDVTENAGISAITKNPDVSSKTLSGADLWEYYLIYDKTYYSDKVGQYLSDSSDDTDIYTKNVNVLRPHFYVGADRGLLKDFSFNKVALGEDLAIIRNLRQGNPTNQLWAIFNVSLRFIGNDLMRVGKTIYLDPSITGLGSPLQPGTVSNLMGLGGYYLVTKVSHSYYPQWETQVEAVSVLPEYLRPGYVSPAQFEYY
jgi:hypothetical protein